MALSDLIYIDGTGYHYPDFPTTLEAVQSMFTSIYGADTYLGADSQDGQWTTALAQMIYDSATVGLATYNSMSPVTAQGVGLSRLVKLNGLARIGSTYSTVALTIVGTAGTVLSPVGGSASIATDNQSQQWLIPSNTVIPSGGSITVTATAAFVGSLSAGIGTVTTITTPIQGWQSVTNATAAIPGQGVESDASLRARQQASTSDAAQSLFSATVGQVANVLNVSAIKGYENKTDNTDGNGLPPHSVAIVVQGGLDASVAQVIQLNKTPGVNTYGTTTVTTYDSRGMPVPISFIRPTAAAIGAQVALTTLPGYSPAYDGLIQAAVSAAITAAGIGGNIILTQLFVASYLVGTPAYGSFTVNSVTINKNGGSFAASNIQLAFNEIPVCLPAAVSVTP